MALYTLFGQPSSPAPLQSDTTSYTLGTQFYTTQACGATAVWFYSAPGVGILPTQIAIFEVNGQTLLHSETAAWSGTYGSGWVRAVFTNQPALIAGTNYKVAVLGGGGGHNWYAGTSDYWDTGPGQNGITSGILNAPGSASAGVQCTFIVGGTLAYPDQEYEQSNYWIDIEVSDMYVVQSVAGGQGTSTLDFSNAVGNGNSVVIIAQGYSGGTVSSDPTYNGSTPTGSAQLAFIDPSEQGVYAGIWLMPNLTGGSTGVGITITGGSNGFTALEVAGLGDNPQLDADGGMSVAYGTTAGAMPSGDTPTLAASNALLIGTAAAYGDSSYTAASGWASLPSASFSLAQYQIVADATGNTYQYDPTGVDEYWGSLIIALEPKTANSGITYNTGTTSHADNATQVQFTVPEQVNVGDVMLLSFECFTEDSSTPTIGFSGGGGTWSLVPMTDGSPNPQSSVGGGIYSYGFAYYRVAVSADIGATITVTETGSPAGSTWLDIALVAYTGANQFNPIDRAGSAGVPYEAGTTGITFPTETARIAGDWAVYMLPCGAGISSSLTGPTGATLRQSIIDSTGIASAIWDSNGTTGLASVGGGTGKSNIGGACWFEAFTICLAPAGIYVVQTFNSDSWSGSLSNNATPGNTLLMLPVSYAVPSDTTSSAPLYNGSSVSGAAQVWSVQSTSGSNDMYSSLWMLPDLPTAATSFGVTVSGGLQPSPLCANLLLEILGLGSSPIVDQTNTAFGSSGTSSVGPTGAIRGTSELIVASGAVYGSYPSDGPGSPWTDFTDPSNQHAIVSWQEAIVSGGTYSWAESGDGSPWAGGIATISPVALTSTPRNNSALLMVGIA